LEHGCSHGRQPSPDAHAEDDSVADADAASALDLRLHDDQ